MKKIVFLLVLMCSLCVPSFAQDDDVYFIPSKSAKSHKTQNSSYSQNEYEQQEVNYAKGNVRDVDEYNRRGHSNYANENNSDDTFLINSQNYYDDSDATDDNCTQRIIRFHSPTVNVYVSSPYYWEYSYNPVWSYSSWNYYYDRGWGWNVGWRSPYYYSGWPYDPWYWDRPYWGCHRPIYRPVYHPRGNPRINSSRGGRTLAGSYGPNRYGTFGRGNSSLNDRNNQNINRPSSQFGRGNSFSDRNRNNSSGQSSSSQRTNTSNRTVTSGRSFGTRSKTTNTTSRPSNDYVGQSQSSRSSSSSNPMPSRGSSFGGGSSSRGSSGGSFGSGRSFGHR